MAFSSSGDLPDVNKVLNQVFAIKGLMNVEAQFSSKYEDANVLRVQFECFVERQERQEDE